MHSCLICFENIANNEAVALPCGHVFDRQCALKWINGKHNCAVCRKVCHPREIIPLFFNDQGQQSYEPDNKELQEVTKELRQQQKMCLHLKSELADLKRSKNTLEEKVRLLTAQNDKIKQQYLSSSEMEHHLSQKVKKLTKIASLHETKLTEMVLFSAKRAEDERLQKQLIAKLKEEQHNLKEDNLLLHSTLSNMWEQKKTDELQKQKVVISDEIQHSLQDEMMR